MLDDLPALLGGTAVCPDGPPLWPFTDHAVTVALQAALADGSWGQYRGPHVPALEAALAEFHHVSQAFTCASGTVAIEVALRSCGVGVGDEVIMGAYDYEPSFLSIHAVGAVPVLVDSNDSNVCLNLELVANAITPKTKAILATHLHGGLVEMPKFMELAAAHNISVIEDAAQVIGAQVAGVAAGATGDVGILSFGGSKLLTAGRGGAVLVRNPALAQRVKLNLSRGLQQHAPLSELQAAALLPQLQILPVRTQERQRNVQLLVRLLEGIPGLRPFANTLTTITPAYYKVGFYYDEAAFGLSRELFVKALRAEGIAFDPGFRALHVGRATSRYKAVAALPCAEKAGTTVVTLHHPVLALSVTAIEQVASAVQKTYRNATRLR